MPGLPDRPESQGAETPGARRRPPALARRLARKHVTLALVAVATAGAALQLALGLLHPHVAPGQPQQQQHYSSWLPPDDGDAPHRQPSNGGSEPSPPAPARAVQEDRGTAGDADVHTVALGDPPTTEPPPIDRALDMTSFAVSRIPLEVQRGNTSSIPKIPVVLWPLVELGPTTAESRSVLKDGVEQSPWLELATDAFAFDPNVVWVGDIGYAYDYNVSCTNFNDLILEAQQKRTRLNLPRQWPVFVSIE